MAGRALLKPVTCFHEETTPDLGCSHGTALAFFYIVDSHFRSPRQPAGARRAVSHHPPEYQGLSLCFRLGSSNLSGTKACRSSPVRAREPLQAAFRQRSLRHSGPSGWSQVVFANHAAAQLFKAQTPDALVGLTAAAILPEDILIGTRIIGAVDVVESMTSHRPYRPARTLDEAVQELESNKGILCTTQPWLMRSYR